MLKELSVSQMEQIKSATEDILETVGFCVQHKEILRYCHNAGASIDEIKQIVRIPRTLLKELLKQVPSSYTISGVGGTNHVIGGDNQHCLAIVTDPWVIDYETQRPRRPGLNDLKRHTIIAQKLENVVAISLMDFPVTDVPGPISSLRALEEHLLNHSKHILCLPTNINNYRRWLEIGQIMRQGKDLAGSRLFSIGVAVVSPLTLTEFNGDLLLSAGTNGFPVVPTICPMAGSTSPYTLASTLLLGNTENIFMAALSQIINQGTPFQYSFGPSVTNMRTGKDMYYTLDKVLWKLASVQLAKSYNIPVSAACGGTMVYRYDQQNGAEGILFMLAAYASKANFLSGIGSCYNAIGMSAEMMLIQTAWLEAAKYLVSGINTDTLHLGLENIKNAGPGGNFLTDELTLKFLRAGEFFENNIFDFCAHLVEDSSLLTRAHNKAEELVTDFKSPIPEKVQEDLRRFFYNEYRKIDD